jgi:electron transport complex protein RnfG
MSSSSVVKSGATLASVAAICTALVAVTWHYTRDRIAANEQAFLERSLQPALAGVFFEGGVTESKIVIPATADTPGTEDVIVYRVFAEEKPVAALFDVTAPDGYSGPIRVLVGIEFDGKVTGVRIVEHRETPGLGDRIESSRSDWVNQFEGRSLVDPGVDGWAIERDGGAFEQLSGASVTPRAVIKVLRETLLYFDAHRDQLFTAQSDGTNE